MTCALRARAVKTCASRLQANTAEAEKLKAALVDVSEENIAAAAEEAQRQLATQHEALENAAHEVDTAKAELAGIESGNGRDESNRSMPERLRDTEAEIVRHSVLHAHADVAAITSATGDHVRTLAVCLSSRKRSSRLNSDIHVTLQKQQDAAVKKAKVAMQHLESEVSKARQEAAGKQAEDAHLQGELDAKRAALDAAQAAHDRIALDEDAVQQLEATVARESAAVQQLAAKRRKSSGSIGHMLDCLFSLPRPDFDRRAVRGVLARLVRVQHGKHALALEVAAGSKLQNLVVTTDQVGARLLCCLLLQQLPRVSSCLSHARNK
jgi:structural maintenance of chromosome 2